MNLTTIEIRSDEGFKSVMSIVSNTYFPSDILALIADERIAARFSKGYRLG